MTNTRVPVRIAVLTVSDTRDEASDKSGKLLVERLGVQTKLPRQSIELTVDGHQLTLQPPNRTLGIVAVRPAGVTTTGARRSATAGRPSTEATTTTGRTAEAATATGRAAEAAAATGRATKSAAATRTSATAEGVTAAGAEWAVATATIG